MIEVNQAPQNVMEELSTRLRQLEVENSALQNTADEVAELKAAVAQLNQFILSEIAKK